MSSTRQADHPRSQDLGSGLVGAAALLLAGTAGVSAAPSGPLPVSLAQTTKEE